MTLMDMHQSKALGPDGLPTLFFQKFWSILGEDITREALNILNGQGDVGIWNSTLITLIPKIKEPRQSKILDQLASVMLCIKIFQGSLSIVSRQF